MRDRLGERALLRGQLPVPLLIVGLGELRVQRSERRARREVGTPRRAPERSLKPANPLRLVFLEASDVVGREEPFEVVCRFFPSFERDTSRLCRVSRLDGHCLQAPLDDGVVGIEGHA